jgi:CRISPR/Cas system-associated exonuclease Cas4 (RecB family)
MSQYYNPKLDKKYLFDPKAKKPFRLSRSKIDSFLACPRCFYLDRRLGVRQPPGFPFALNSAVDALLKKEFDAHRAAGTPHPYMAEQGIDAIPFAHEQMDAWRDSLRGGITFQHKPTNFFVTGGIDDVWVNPKGDLHIVDYKSTAKTGEVSLDADWQEGYKRQMEIYQWLFRKNDFKVSDTGYFVYCNGKLDNDSFDQRLEFDVKIIPYKGSDKWVEKTIKGAHKVLSSETIPEAGEDCDFCSYRFATHDFEVSGPEQKKLF